MQKDVFWKLIFNILKSFENYQLKIADHYNMPIGNVKKLVPNLFDKEKYFT